MPSHKNPVGNGRGSEPATGPKEHSPDACRQTGDMVTPQMTGESGSSPGVSMSTWWAYVSPKAPCSTAHTSESADRLTASMTVRAYSLTTTPIKYS